MSDWDLVSESDDICVSETMLPTDLLSERAMLSPTDSPVEIPFVSTRDAALRLRNRVRRPLGVGLRMRATAAHRPAHAATHAGDRRYAQRAVDAGAERAERVDAVADPVALHHPISDRPALADAFSHAVAFTGADLVRTRSH